MTASAHRHDNLPSHLAIGYEAFANGRFKREKGAFEHLASAGQKPPTLLIGCCDSRVAPEVVFNAGPGEIFVVRNIAALVPPYDKAGPHETSAAIEYAVIALKVAHIVVMGHSQCGGVRACALDKSGKFPPISEANFVARWKTLIDPAAEQIGPPSEDFDAYCERLCQASIIHGLANLRTYPWVKAAEDEGKLSLHGAYFEIAHARVAALDQHAGKFVPVSA